MVSHDGLSLHKDPQNGQDAKGCRGDVVHCQKRVKFQTFTLHEGTNAGYKVAKDARAMQYVVERGTVSDCIAAWCKTLCRGQMAALLAAGILASMRSAVRCSVYSHSSSLQRNQSRVQSCTTAHWKTTPEVEFGQG